MAAMRYLLTILVILTVVNLGLNPSFCKAPASRQTIRGSSSAAGEAILKMVFIHASSPGSIKQLRAMHVDIIRVRQDHNGPADKNSLSRGFIVEAVVPADILPKLRAIGFDVSEVPPPYK
jgi:hypothetical protein